MSFPRPSRALVWTAFYAAVALGWIGLWASLDEHLLHHADQIPLGRLWAMWSLMVAAMMLPTFAPTLSTFLDLRIAGATRGRDAFALVLGYGLVWLGGALLGALAQAGLARVAPHPGTAPALWIAAGLMAGAGLYQLSPAKAACLSKCRMPITYFMGRWRPGSRQALMMGLELGALCLGCCWALMALGLIGGAMTLLWMGLATLFMIFEKLPDIGRWLTRPSGWALIGAGALTAFRALG